ncbi:hypothetical protein D9756_007352 [Leucocoprinus leucothites]|uniref:Uncharacterized protein n=1 Tax=Leucocoprinus leucothites TaxID=201217 RepID=A0A8H5D823_9AGAR|nr:hypothetical protein D9756_007352 [Leucoagaricus leucothites]
MVLQPEIEAALRADLPTRELISILRKHQLLPIGEYYYELSGTDEFGKRFAILKSRHHLKSSYWECWGPLVGILSHSSKYVDPIIVREDESEVSYQNMDLRKAAWKRLLKWLCDPLRGGNLLLIRDVFLWGSQSAFSKVATQTCLTMNRLGAIIPISPLLIQYQPRELVQALCDQLCKKFPPYRRVLAETLMDTPTIFNKLDFFYLLRMLIILPWNKLKISHPQYVVTPIVIFLDWYFDPNLDTRERGINSYLRDLLWLITEDRLVNSPCLLWIMTGYWDPLTISAMFWQDPLRFQHIRELIGNDEATRYTEAILSIRFQGIHNRHPDLFDSDEQWPLEDELKHIARVISSVDIFIELLTRFVDLGGPDGPRKRLNKCLAYISNSPCSTLESPFKPLIHFYNQFMSDIPSQFFPHAIHVLECLYQRALAIPSPSRIAHLLCINQSLIHPIFSYLEWTLDKKYEEDKYTSQEPKYSLPGDARVIFYLSQYLGQPVITESCIIMIESYFYFFQNTPLLSTKPRFYTPGSVSGVDPRTAVMHTIGSFHDDWHHFVSLCRWAPRMEGDAILALLRSFDFCCLAHIVSLAASLSHFTWFLMCVLTTDQQQDLIRTKATTIMDTLFIDKVKGIAEPLDLSELVPSKHFPYESFQFPKFVLLGKGLHTVLVILLCIPAQDKGIWTEDVSVYTLRMLEDF